MTKLDVAVKKTKELDKELNPDQLVRAKLQELRLMEYNSSPWQKFQFKEHPELLTRLAQRPIPEWDDLLSFPPILKIYNNSTAIKKIRDKFGKDSAKLQ